MIISLEEFCNDLKINLNNDMFFKCYRGQFYITKSNDGDPIYNFSDGSGIITQFKAMPQYEETWIRTLDTTAVPPSFSLWSTYKVW